MNKRQLDALNNVLDYLYADEEKNWLENDKPSTGHIFNDVGVLGEYSRAREQELAKPIHSWRQDARDYARDAFDGYKEDIDKAIDEYPTPDEKDFDELRDEIFDHLYQKLDLTHIAQEAVYGRFIYNHTNAMIEALDCIDELSDFDEETDSGLWEGSTEIHDIINAQAQYTFANAVYNELEEIIKAHIEEGF